jgi:hypothetical protein
MEEEMPGAKRERGERALIFAATMAELPIEEVREMLTAAFPTAVLPDNAYKTLLNDYAPVFKAEKKALAEAIRKGMSWTRLKEYKDGLVAEPA